jgi:hypothetical protein
MYKYAFIILLLLVLSVCYMAGAEEETKYILCNPRTDNHVAIRNRPKKNAEETGRLDCGDDFVTDGKIRNGYLHVIGMTEDGEGWVHLGYVVDDKPLIEKCNGTITANGRVMSWRRINSGKNGWLEICDQVKIYARTDEWAVTNKGYVRTKYLEVWYDN